MSTVEPPAEVRQHQVSLFEDPLSKLYQIEDALKEEEKMIKEMEKDYPVEIEELLEQVKEVNDDLKERKEYFVNDLRNNNEDYQEASKRKAELKIQRDELLAQVKDLAIKQEDELDLTIEVNGTIVRLQTQKEKKVYLDGKEV